MGETVKLPTDVRTESPWRGIPTNPHSIRGGVLLVLLTSLCCLPEVDAGETIYNNTDLLLSQGERIFPESGNGFLAQPFEIGEDTSISSFAINLSRWGTPSGSVDFSIWDETAAGFPGQRVSDLGSVDVSLLEDVGTQPETLPTLTFDTSVIGLVPEEQYYVVADMTDLEGGHPSPENTVLFGALRSAEGTKVAGELILANAGAQPPFSAADWVSSGTVFGGSRYLQMRVESMPSELTSTVFDNTEVDLAPNPRHQFVNALGSDRRFAQQFLMDDHNSVDEVTVSLIRQGSASGNMIFEIWSDNGRPNEKIAELGKILDVSLIPTDHTEFTFESQITGLHPDEPYWVVANYSEANVFDGSNSIGWTAVLSDEGTFGAANAYGSTDMGQTWFDIGQVIHDPLKFRMEVITASSVPRLLGDINEDGRLGASDIDALALAVRLGLDGSKYDVNNDGHVNSDDQVYWVGSSEIANTYFGDANLDGEFNSGDLVTVFQAGEYEDEEDMNSTWATGDWNGDGDFDTSDLVRAFQDGGFEKGPKVALNAVPEPASFGLSLLGLIGIAIRLGTRRPTIHGV